MDSDVSSVWKEEEISSKDSFCKLEIPSPIAQFRYKYLDCLYKNCFGREFVLYSLKIYKMLFPLESTDFAHCICCLISRRTRAKSRVFRIEPVPSKIWFHGLWNVCVCVCFLVTLPNVCCCLDFTRTWRLALRGCVTNVLLKASRWSDQIHWFDDVWCTNLQQHLLLESFCWGCFVYLEVNIHKKNWFWKKHALMPLSHNAKELVSRRDTFLDAIQDAWQFSTSARLTARLTV